MYKEHHLHLPCPLLSILAAVLTVSPNKQYLGMINPTTPATTGPLCKPCNQIKLSCNWNYPVTSCRQINQSPCKCGQERKLH